MSSQKIINTFDLYGFTPSLFIGGYHRNGSVLGIISTIISIIAEISISIFFFLKLFNTNEFTVITSETNPEGIESVEISKNSFYFTFALEDPFSYKSFIDEGIYYPKVTYKLAKRNKEEGLIWTVKDLEYGPCELSDFHHTYQKYFENHNLSNSYCIKNLNESLKGIFQKSEYSFLFIELFECRNSTEKNNCKSQKEIDYYLDGTFISIQYQGLNIDPNNYHSPNLSTISEYYTTISHNFFKEIHIYFKKILISTDKGWMFPDIHTKKFSQFDHAEDMISLKNSEKANFLEFSIKFADIVQKYIRTYTKAQTVISNIGGFIKFIQSFFVCINYIFAEGNVYQRIINKIFYIDHNIISSNNNLITIKNFKSKTKDNNIFETIYSDFPKITKKNSFKQSNINSNKTKTIFNLNSNSSIGKNSFDIFPIHYNKNLENKSEIPIRKKKKKEDSNKRNLFNKSEKQRNNCSKTPFNHLNNNSIYDNKNKDIKKIKLSYCEKFWVRFTYDHKNNLISLYRKGKGFIEQKLDIICIIKDSFKLSLLEKMFFNEENSIILDNIMKTELSHLKYSKDIYILKDN